MKSILRTMFLFVLAILGARPFSAQQRYVIGLPGRMDAGTGTAVQRAVLRLILEAPNKACIQVIDASTLQQVVELQVPDSSNAKRRVQHLRKEISEISSFFTRVTSDRSGQQDLIRVPQFLGLVGSLLRASSSSTIVLVFGSQFYRAEGSRFSFGEGIYPGDGTVHATSRESLYGTADKPSLLEGAVVHWSYLTENWSDELERPAVTRFWKIYCDGQGATLSSFEASPDVVLTRALVNARDPVVSATIDPDDRAIVMRRVSDDAPIVEPPTPRVPEDSGESPQETSPAPQVEEPLPVPETPPINEELAKALIDVPRPESGELIIAAVWMTEKNGGSADVDLYVRSHPGAPELFFQNTVTPDGEYLRDIRWAGPALDVTNWGAAWEAVVLRDSPLDRVSLWLDVFKGAPAPIHGVVRLSIGDRVIDQPFEFPALAGDGGSGRGERQESACWAEIDLMGMFERDARRLDADLRPSSRK